MFKTKLSFLLIAILLLNIDFLLSYPAFANEINKVTGTKKAEIESRFNSTGSFNRASNPDCGKFKTAAALAGIAIVVGVIWTGLVVIVSSAGIFTAFVILGVIAAVVGVWKAIGGWVICDHSFVRHPVARDHDGKYRNFKLKNTEYSSYTDKNYQTEDEYFSALKGKSGKDGKQTEKEALDLDNSDIVGSSDIPGSYYWPKNAVQYSEYIEICHRNPLTFSRLFWSDTSIKGDFDVRERDTEYEGGSWSPRVDGALECKALKAGQSQKIHNSKFKAVKKMGRLCVELDEISMFGISMNPWPQGIDIGCTDLPPDPLAPMCERSEMIFKSKDSEKDDDPVPISKDEDYKTIIRSKEKDGKIFVGYENKKCFQDHISEACYNQAGSKALAPLPITSMIVQCIKESLDNLVAGTDSSGKILRDDKGQAKGSFIFVAQKRLKNTITAVLVLALMLFSIKVMTGGVQKPQEMYMLIIKFALVMYFTTGDGMQKYYGYLTKLSNGLSEVVLKASSESKNICNYEAKDYEYSFPGGKTRSYGYLAPWDRLDCRILFYLGAPLGGIGGKVITGSAALTPILFGAAPMLLAVGSIIGVILAGGQILIVLVCILMAILMMMTILWICYVFILSLVALSVIVILSPLFIPMVLFQHTRGYFDGWLKELITYSLYPVMLFAFLSFMFIACDKIYYKELRFEKEEITIPILGNTKRWFKLKEVPNSEGKPISQCDETENESTLACALQNYSFKKSSILGIFDFTYMEFKNSLLGELLKLVLVLFLFYHFLGILPAMAAELAGNTRSSLGSGATPQRMMGKAISLARAAAGDVSQIAKIAGGAGKSRSSGPKGD